jgi:hypothetical protein
MIARSGIGLEHGEQLVLLAINIFRQGLQPRLLLPLLTSPPLTAHVQRDLQ